MVNTLQLVRQGRAEDKCANVLICNREIIMPPFGPEGRAEALSQLVPAIVGIIKLSL